MESILTNLKHQVQCLLCNKTMFEPKLLQCFHTFCKSCVKENSQVDGNVHIFKCPKCDSQTQLQDLNDVEDLQTSPVHSRIVKVLDFIESQNICSVSSSHPEASWQCLDCDKVLCEECHCFHSEFTKNHQVISLSDFKKEDIEKLLRKEKPCKDHSNQEVALHCNDCDMLICILCCKEAHHNHKTTLLQEYINIEKRSLSKNIKEIGRMNTEEQVKNKQQEIAITIKRDGEKAKREIDQLADELINEITESKRKLFSEIQESIIKADRNLRAISYPTQAQEYIGYFMENCTASEMIDARQGECYKNFTYNSFEELINGIVFTQEEKLCAQVKAGLGLVLLLEMADPKIFQALYDVHLS